MGISAFNTPLPICRTLVERIELRPGQVLWEPHSGSGNFVRAIFEKIAHDRIRDMRVYISDIDPGAPALHESLLDHAPVGLNCEIEQFPCDFLMGEPPENVGVIFGNPPYNLPPEPGQKRGKSVVELHILRAIALLRSNMSEDGRQAAFLLKNSVVESVKRRDEIWTPYPPRHVDFLARRIPFEDYEGEKKGEGQDKYGYAWVRWTPTRPVEPGKTTMGFI